MEKAVKAEPGTDGSTAAAATGLPLALFVPTSRYLTAVARAGARTSRWARPAPISGPTSGTTSPRARACWFLLELRRCWATNASKRSWIEFGRTHAGQTVTTASFFEAAEKAHGKSLESLKDTWLNGEAITKLGPDVQARKASGRFWSVDSFERQLDKAADRLRHAGRGRRPA